MTRSPPTTSTRHRDLRRQDRHGPPGPVRPARVEPSYPPSTVQPAGSPTTQRPPAWKTPRLRRPATEGPAQVRGRGPQRRPTTTPRAVPVALEPARQLGQGQRVLPAAPARHRTALRRPRRPEDQRPRPSRGPTRRAEGKLDLLMTIDFRMTSSTILFGRRPARGHLVRSTTSPPTDMHPFVHSFNPPSPRRGDQVGLGHLEVIAKKFSELAETHLGTRCRGRQALWHDTRRRWPSEHGRRRDWRLGPDRRLRARPGQDDAGHRRRRTRLHRDLRQDDLDRAADGERRHAHQGRGLRRQARDRYPPHPQRRHPRRRRRRPAKVETDVQMADAILHLAGVSNGHLAVQGFKFLEKRTGTQLARPASEHEGKQITFADTQVAPVPVITSPEWSGSESGGRRYSPFTINIERKPVSHPHRSPAVLRRPRLVPRDGEMLPGLPPTVEHDPPVRGAPIGTTGELESRRALPDTPQQVVHPPEYQDNLFMLSLSRGGQSGCRTATQPRSGCGTTTGSRWSTATASSQHGPSSATGCPRERSHAPRPGPAHRRAAHRADGKRGASTTASPTRC